MWTPLGTTLCTKRYIRHMSTKSTRRTPRQGHWGGSLMAGFGTLRIDPSNNFRDLRIQLSRRNAERMKLLFKNPSPEPTNR